MMHETPSNENSFCRNRVTAAQILSIGSKYEK